MYRFLDKPLNNSNASEKFIIWVFRGWSAAVQANQCPKHFLRSGFGHGNRENLFRQFSMFLGILHAGRKRQIHFCTLPCPRISDDEALILAAFAGLEAGDKAPAKAVFNDMLEPTGARHAMTMANRLLETLNQEGYSLAHNKQMY